MGKKSRRREKREKTRGPSAADDGYTEQWPLHQKDCLMYQEGLAKARLDREPPAFRKLSLDLPEGKEFEK